ncbi:hypothetical protein EU527_00680 [Candidatus Thorarchaeota archaeon]|nr:MAG: hypothetical protein EU527_00680 [Candidatus Thorarchaeota archaeon]
MGIMDVLKRWSTPRNLLLSVIGSVVIIALMGYGLQTLVYNVYGHYTMPDTRFGYTFEEIQTVFNGIGSEGLQVWTMVHLLDYFFPLVYCFAMIFALGLQLKKLNAFDGTYNKVLFLPIFGCVTDYAENLLVQSQVLTYPNLSALVITIASYVTLLKWILLALGFGVIIILLLLIIVRRYSVKA